jgi:RNA polymerase sigma-70 factor (ECF subfamily)
MKATEDRLKDLLVRGLEGDAASYGLFLKELSALLRGFLRRRLTRLPDHVEDLVQETLFALHNQRHTYDPNQPVTAWVQAIARYKLIDMLRRRSTHDALNDPLDEDMPLLAHSDAESADAQRDVATLLERLPASQRLPIIYTKLEGLSVIEAAERAGMSISAVKVGVHRGLKALAAMLREES